MARNALENHKKNLGHNLFRFNLPVKLKNSNLIGPKYMFVPSCREVKASTGSFCFLGWGCGEEWSPGYVCPIMNVLRVPVVGP